MGHSRICAGLALGGYQVAAILPNSAQLTREVEKLAPDIILIETDSPSRDTLEHLAVVHEHMPRPVILFTSEGEGETIREAIRVGVSAYIVDGLDAKRIKPVIEVARAHFAEHQALRQELAASHQKLSDRKPIDRAYHALRKLAMERGKTMGDVAKDVLDMASLFS